MTRWVALLYSVILSSSRRLTSADLLTVAGRAGCANARTVLSSGNLIVDADGDEADLEGRLERAVLAALGKAIPVFVRRAPDWQALVSDNPFQVETSADPACVAVRVMRRMPDQAVLDRIAATARTSDRFVPRDRALWIASPGQLSQSPLARAAAASWAGPGTFRNASAVAKIAAAL